MDLELPEIKISNIKDKSANKDKVAPIIEICDLNYQTGGFTINITGSNEKKLKLKKSVKNIKRGQKYRLPIYPEQKKQMISIHFP